jgi:hypothetical protein
MQEGGQVRASFHWITGYVMQGEVAVTCSKAPVAEGCCKWCAGLVICTAQEGEHTGVHNTGRCLATWLTCGHVSRTARRGHRLLGIQNTVTQVLHKHVPGREWSQKFYRVLRTPEYEFIPFIPPIRLRGRPGYGI